MIKELIFSFSKKTSLNKGDLKNMCKFQKTFILSKFLNIQNEFKLNQSDRYMKEH